MKMAASKPAEGVIDISFVKRYVAKAVRPENAGARRTQMFRMSTGSVNALSAW